MPKNFFSPDGEMPGACEFYSGIGGAAVALKSLGYTIALAVDIDQLAMRVYQDNFPTHPTKIAELATFKVPSFDVDLWWLSPPCLPFTTKGRQRDLDDRRCESLMHLLAQVKDHYPQAIAIENVPPFAESRAAEKITTILIEAGYEVAVELRCPTELGWPMRLKRCYLLASRSGLNPLPSPQVASHAVADFVTDNHDDRLVMPSDIMEQYHQAIDVIDPEQANATARCFASAYGRSLTGSGSYLQQADGKIRMFSPQEILRLLGFPATFTLNNRINLQAAYRLTGNSVSVPVIHWVLQRLPQVATRNEETVENVGFSASGLNSAGHPLPKLR